MTTDEMGKKKERETERQREREREREAASNSWSSREEARGIKCQSASSPTPWSLGAAPHSYPT